MKPHRIIGALLVLTTFVVPAIAIASPADQANEQAKEKPFKVLVADPEPREFVAAVHEDLRFAADEMAVKAMERWGGIDKRTGTDLHRRMRPVFFDISALKADLRGADIVVKNGKPQKLDWCIGEKMLLTLFPDETLTVQNTSIEEIAQLKDHGGGYIWNGVIVDEPDSEVRLGINPMTGSITGFIQMEDGTRYHIRPTSETPYHVIWEVDKEAINRQGGDDPGGVVPNSGARLGLQEWVKAIASNVLDRSEAIA